MHETGKYEPANLIAKLLGSMPAPSGLWILLASAYGEKRISKDAQAAKRLRDGCVSNSERSQWARLAAAA